MIKPPKKWADNWLELFGNGILLLLILPLIVAGIIIALPLLALYNFRSWVRREPKPDIPEVLSDPNLKDQQKIAAEYVAKAKVIVNDLIIKHDEYKGEYTLTSPRLGKRAVRVSYDEYYTPLRIDDLNCYVRDNTNTDPIYLFFWVAVGALQHGVCSARSGLGRQVYWTKSDELGVWIKVQRVGSMYDGTDFYNEPPKNVSSLLQVSS